MLTQNKKIILLLLLISLVSVELLRTAWISDDAAITLRVKQKLFMAKNYFFGVA